MKKPRTPSRSSQPPAGAVSCERPASRHMVCATAECEGRGEGRGCAHPSQAPVPFPASL